MILAAIHTVHVTLVALFNAAAVAAVAAVGLAVLAASDNLVGIALIITAIGGALGGVAAAITALVALRKINDVKAAVDTGNSSTVGMIAQLGFGKASMDVAPEKRTKQEEDAIAMLSASDRATHAEVVSATGVDPEPPLQPDPTPEKP